MSEEPDTRHVRTPQAPGRPVYSQYTPGDDEWEAQHASMMATFKDAGVENSEIAVYRRGKKESRFKYVDTVGVDGFSIQGIAEEYGGGKYQFKTKLGGNLGPVFCVEIDDRILGALDKQGGAPSGPVTDPIAMLRTVKEVLGDNKDSGQFELIRTMMEQTEKNRTSQSNLLVGLVTAVAPIIAALLTRPQPAPNDKLFEIVMPFLLNKPNTDMAASLEFVKGLKALATDRPERDTGGMLEKIMTMAATALPALAGAMAPQITRQVGPPMNPQPQLPSDQFSPGEPGQPGPQGQAPPPDVSALVPRVYAAMLCKAAQTDAPVEPWVEIIEQLTDDAQWGGLQDLLLRADWLAIISAQLPELAPFPGWLARLRDALLIDDEAELPPADPPPADPPAPTTGPKAKKLPT